MGKHYYRNSSRLIIGILLFNVCINDLFLFVSNSHLRNYADDNLHVFGYNLVPIKNILRFDFELASRWFEKKLYGYKCHFMCLGEDTENETFFFDNFIFNNSNEEKILGITIDNKLTFKSRIKILSRKAIPKIGPL